MNLLLTVFASLLWFGFSWYIYSREKRNDSGQRFLFLYGYRVFFLMIQMIIYTYFYDSICDSILFHEKLTHIYSAIIDHPSDFISFYSGSYNNMSIDVSDAVYLSHEPRVAFFLKVLLPFFVLSAGNYIVLCLWITLLGTCCLNTFLKDIQNKTYVAFWYMAFLIPSFCFWTTGIFKEACVIPLFFLMFTWIRKIIQAYSKSWIDGFLFILFLYITWNIKYYFAAAFLVFCLGYIFITNIKKMFVALSILTGSVLLAMILFGYLHPNLSLQMLPEAITANYLATCNNVIPEKCIPFSLDGSWMSVLKNVPDALTYVVYSPTIFQIDDLTTILAAFESHLLLIILLYTVYRCIKEKQTIERADVLLLMFVLLVGVFLIISSPNLGSFSRYRVFYLPVYGYLLFKYSHLDKKVPLINRIISSGSK